WIRRGRIARAGGGAGGFRYGQRCSAFLGAERDGAVTDAAATDRGASQKSAALGGGGHSRGCSDCGAAPLASGAAGPGDFRNQSRREYGRECLLLWNGGSSA